MAAKEFMDTITTFALFGLILLVRATAGARYSGEARETQPDITFTAMDGPVPTEAPLLLRKRATQNSDNYPPSSWCGFVDGDSREF